VRVTSAHAQAAPSFTVRGFADIGARTFLASQSFRAIFGRPVGPVFGGGVDIVGHRGLLAELHATEFRRTGQRAFVFDNSVFNLSVPDTITITSVEGTVGYRFNRRRHRRLVPYAAGGVGWHHYSETSPGAAAGDNVTDNFIGYHVLGGLEVRLRRWLATAGEGQWTIIPNALGKDPNSVSAAYGESDLGGGTIRFKLIIGR
jgi:hypothetical protein